MRSLIMALVATLFVGSAVGAHAQTAAHQPSYKKHLPGVFEYLKDAAGPEVGFKCNWPYDQHCATILVHPGPSASALSAASGSSNARYAVWFPSIKKGYVDVRYTGATSDPYGTSVTYHIVETSNTSWVTSLEEIEAWIESLD